MVNTPELHLRVGGEAGIIGLVCLLQELFGLNRERTAILPRVAWSTGAVLSSVWRVLCLEHVRSSEQCGAGEGFTEEGMCEGGSKEEQTAWDATRAKAQGLGGWHRLGSQPRTQA